MKILVYTDPHIFAHGEGSIPTSDGLTTHLHRVIAGLKWVQEMIGQHKPDLVICGGDIHHTHDFVDAMSLHASIEYISGLVKSCTGFGHRTLLGNHDIAKSGTGVHTLDYLHHVEGSGLMVKSHIEEFSTTTAGKVKILYLPYTEDFQEVERCAKEDKYDIVFAHLDWLGAKMSQKYFSDKGADPSWFNAPIFSGHYHVPGVYDGKTKHQLNIIGSLGTRTFHDLEGPMAHGALLLELQKGKNKLKSIERLANPHYLMFRKAEVKSVEDIGMLIGSPLTARTALRVFCPIELKPEAEALRKAYASCHIVPMIEAERLAPTDVDITLSPEDNFRAYLNEEPHRGLKAKTLESMGMEILKSALSASNQVVQSMTRLTFESLRIENFQSIEVMDVPLQGQGFVLLEGVNETDPGQLSNGAGKSSIVEALMWVLFGWSPKQDDGVNAVIRDTGPGWCRVVLHLRVGDMEYVVTRTRNHPELKTGLQISTGDGNVTSRHVKEAQRELDTMLAGMDLSAFRNVVMLSRSLEVSFSGLGPTERLRLIEKLAGLAVFDQCQSLVASQVQSLTAEVDALQRAVAIYETDSEKACAALAVVDTDLKWVEDNVKAATASAANVIQESSQAMDAYQEELRGMDQSISEINSTVEELQKNASDAELAYINLQQAMTKHSSAWSVVHAEKSRVEALAAQDACPTCGTAIAVTGVNDLIKELEGKTTLCQQDLDNVKEKLEAALTHRDGLRKRAQFKAQNMQKLNQKRAKVSDEIQRLAFAKAKAEKSIADAELQKSALEAQKKIYLQQIKDSKNSLKGKGKEIKEKERLREHWEWLYDPRRRLGVFSVKGLRAKVLEKVVEFVNSRCQAYSEVFYKDRFIRLVFDNGKITAQMTGGRAPGRSSSGEARRSDLVIQFALNDLASATSGALTNVLICDEIDDRLDRDGLEQLAQVLQDKARRGMSVFLVTQNPDLKAVEFVDRRWVAVKDRDMTTLVITDN